MNNERKQAAKNFLKMLIEDNIPLRVGQEGDRIVLCLGLVLMLDADEETREIVIKLKDIYTQQEINEGLETEFNPYVTGILSNFDHRILDRTNSPINIQDIVGEL